MNVRLRKSERILLALLAAVCTLSFTGVASVLHLKRFGLAVDGLEHGAVLKTAAVREVSVTAEDPSALDKVDVFVDDEPVLTRRDGDRLRLHGFEPVEGVHTLRARVRGASLLWLDAEIEHNFTIDNTAPSLTIDRTEAADPRTSITVRGTTSEAVLVRVGQNSAQLLDGTFEVTVPAAATVFVEARDTAGNATGRHMTVPVVRPAMRVAHLTPGEWTSPQSRQAVFAMARKGEIDTVVLDVKDEAGQVPYLSNVVLAGQIGAVSDRYDPRSAVDQLHRAGLRAVARVVPFRDPVLAKAAWHAGLRGHAAHDGALAFTNSSHPEVRGYVVALAREAASLGFDDVLLDQAGNELPASFLAEAREGVRAAGACLGVVATQGVAGVPADVDFVVQPLG
ncbi:putative glycoside hydrolase [Lentzea albidocapillata]|uniref:Putative glycosyl hydrolase domain-containing protein n=1 Tax=Lentzea albidocapillata TaxID=40571 RepID=A0A1W2F8Q5_9PSEU|nr:putative glycoside hydrolase [Lentzea albidocapillata]SMD17998.1 Putative glycosyl hydrolase domain-containing protein [Lentzea albidocapillata]